MNAPPLATFPTISDSWATDMGYRALADVTAIAEAHQLDHRVVGGLAVSLLVAAHQVGDVPERATGDADIAADIDVLRQSELVDGLRHRGYEPEDGSRWVRPLSPDEREEYPTGTSDSDEIDALRLAVDFMTESLTGNHSPNLSAGDLSVDGFPGINLALAHDPVLVVVSPRLTTGRELTLSLRLPSPHSLLAIKLLAWGGRRTRKDVLDIWRLLATCRVAGVEPSNWWSKGAQGDALKQLEVMTRLGSPVLKHAQLDPREQATFRALALRVVGELPRT